MTDKHDKLVEMARECGGQQLHGVSKCIALSPSDLAAFRDRIVASLQAEDAPSVVREFQNEIGNHIKITIEGPTSTSENTLTPIETAELRRALVDHAASDRRLLACWNAFDGLDTELIESMVNVPEFFFKQLGLLAQRDEILSGLISLVASLAENDDDGLIEHTPQMQAARALISQTQGG